MRIVALAPFGLRPKATLSRRALPMLQAAATRGDDVHVLAPSDLYPADAGSTSVIKQITVEHGPAFGQGGDAALGELDAQALFGASARSGSPV